MKTRSRFFYPVQVCKISLWFLLTGLVIAGYGQQVKNWREMAATGANFYDIKAAFYKQNAARLAEMKAMKAGDAEEEENEGGFSDIVQFMRWAEWTEPRVAESRGDLKTMNERYTKGLVQVNTMKQRMSQFGNDSWTLIGPKMQFNNMAGNGRVNKLRVDPTNANRLFACTPASQLFKSLNGGVSWTSVSNGLPAVGVGDIAIDPSAPNTLYATTGDSEPMNFNPQSAGVFKSTDGGATWNKLNSLAIEQSNQTKLTGIVMNPALPGSFFVSSTNGIYRFTNGGATVAKVATEAMRELTIMPGNPDIMFAGSESNYYGPTKLLRSGNNGLTWTPVTNGLPTNAFRYAISVSPVNPNMVYVWTCTQNSLVSQGVYCSTDAGLTFKQMNAGIPNMCSNQGWFNLCLAADPVDAATLYAGGTYVYRSTDSGKTWVNLSQGTLVHVDIHGLTFSGTSTLYIANDGGVYKTTNAGADFTNISSDLSIAQSYGIGISSFNSKLILSGHQDNGTNLSKDLVDWSQVTGGDGLICLVDRTNDNNMFSTIQYNYIYRSTNGGASFSQVGNSIPKNINWITPLVQDPNVASTIYAASDKLYKSTDYGTNWTAISPVFNGITGVDVDRNNSNTIYLCTYFSMYKTIDGGNNWIPVNNGLTDYGQFISLHIDVNNSAIIYAACSSFLGRNLFRSVDGGASWSLWSDGLPGMPANIVLTQLGSPGEVYCGTDYGVYYRNNASASWTLYNTNLPPAPVRDLKIFYPTGTLRAATFGRGIWESPLAAPIYSCPASYASNRVYVNSNAPGTNTGESWTNAFKNLQDAIKAAVYCGVKEIWVAKGTYYPDRGSDFQLNDWDASFNLKSNVAIYGGFAGNETSLAQRNWVRNKTILSGDIGIANEFADNSYNVVEANGTDLSAILDGFIITGGNANADNGVNPASRGGGLFVGDNSSATINHCVFVKNYSNFGGGIYVKSNTYPVISNCAFTGNDATYDGGAVFNETGAHTSIVNCSFSGNLMTAISNAFNSAAVIKNSVIWGNTNGVTGAAITVSNSIVQGGYAGTGNLNTNPLFVEQPAIAFGASGNLHLTPCSPAIDGGDDAAAIGATDLDGDPRFVTILPKESVVDMGAYEHAANVSTLYVDIAAAGKGDGSGWPDAYQSFYQALQLYNGCGSFSDLLVAAGTYTSPGGLPFIVTKNNGVILGGYPSGGGTRNAIANPVIINGEMQVKKSAQIDGIKIHN